MYKLQVIGDAPEGVSGTKVTFYLIILYLRIMYMITIF